MEQPSLFFQPLLPPPGSGGQADGDSSQLSRGVHLLTETQTREEVQESSSETAGSSRARLKQLATLATRIANHTYSFLLSRVSLKLELGKDEVGRSAL